MDEKQQEMLFRLSLFEQQIQQLQQQLQAVEQGVAELVSLDIELDSLKGSKNKEILANVGRGIFIKSKIESEELIVDIGGRNFVKKSVSETQDIIKEQIKKLEGVKIELNKNLDVINNEITRIILEAEKKQKKTN